MESLDFWRLCDELTVEQAALLVVGENPSGRHFHVEGTNIELQPKGYVAAKLAISSALRNGLIEGNITQKNNHDFNNNVSVPVDGSVDVSASIVEVESLRTWLRSRGISSGFFFPTATDKPDYLNSEHPRYAPKLAAAVNAWLAVTTTGKTSAKQALQKWLREHASEYGMTDDKGNPVNKATLECATIANWDTSGGAPKSQ